MIEQPEGAAGPLPQAAPESKIAIGRNATGRRIGLPEVLLATLIYLAVQFAGAGVILVAFGRDALTSGQALPTLLVVLTAAVSAGLAAVAAGLIRVRSAAAIGLVRPAARWLLIGAGCGLAGFLVNRVVVVSYVAITGDHSSPQQGMAETAMGGLWWQFGLLVLFGAALTPIGEELLFRGIGFGWLRRWGFLIAALLSSGVFGLAHGINAVFPAAILLGLVHAWLYERSGSIWPAVISHAVNNGIAFILARIVLSSGL
ncbi:CPBP family intramembrane glutamic endopeptidase [Microlunatus speluncae]|uniref:CPBP family intramembrane glutamic endopeptidase n=1 Tax=Microlunatus speluncae TaxID=2594267 RepID=UPI00126663F3|nr:CPBP family intramembrane glutamic endopeptidase [Microlunatus speluncae]